jgi:hypothetical protein
MKYNNVLCCPIICDRGCMTHSFFHHVGCTLVALRIFLTQHGNELFKMQWILHFDGKCWWGVMLIYQVLTSESALECCGMR